MVELTFGDVDPWTIREFADNYDEGVWGVGRYTYRDYSQVFVTSFVRKDGDWKWYGNRRPFRQWRFGAEAVRFISPQESSVIVSGLEVYVYDVGNLALDNFGIDFFMVLNDALPELTDEDGNTYHTLIMGRRSDVDTGYRIDNVTTSYWDGWYLERDGLDIDSLSNPEFVFVGVDSSGPTAVHVWIDLLGGKPLKGTELDTTYFPVITTPSSLDPLDLNIPGEVTASWSNPTGMYTDWIELGWYDAQDYTKIELDNPAWNDPTKNFEDWTSYTFDTSQTTIHPVTGAWIFVEAEDLSGREFATQIDIY
jgi:hypothetical protein